MKYNIDPKECKKRGISVGTAIFLLSLYLKSPIDADVIKSAIDEGLICYSDVEGDNTPSEVYLTTKGIQEIETLILNSDYPTKDDGRDEYLLLAKNMRELYPKGLKPGTNQMWRDSIPMVANRLKALKKKFEVEFTSEEALEATKKYINSFQGDYTYMQVLKYFICKKDLSTGEVNSQLLAFLDNDTEVINNDWQTTLR